MAEAELVVDELEARITPAGLRQALDAQTDRLVGIWRRDLLLIITGQLVALAGVLTAVA